MAIHKPLHPGVIVKSLLIKEANLTVTEAAKRLGVTHTTLSRLLNGHSNLTPEMALRLSKLLNTSVEMWVNLQAQYDVWEVKKSAKSIRVKALYNPPRMAT